MASITPLSLFLAALIFSASCAHAAPLRTKSSLAWLHQIQAEAIEAGISPDIVHKALDDFVPNPRIIELDQKQPENIITFEDYRRGILNPLRVNKGRALRRLYAAELNAIEARTGVPSEIIVALWGIESNFGNNLGGFEVIDALATMAYEGRRAAFFQRELFTALRILEQENLSPEDLRGSWAGAMGQCQFMPSTYLKFAVDGDGDGKRDIWNNPIDSLASIANYLAAEGWRRGLSWGREVESGGLPENLIGFETALSLKEWSDKGITNLGGSLLPQHAVQASYVQPDGENGSRFLVYDNFQALRRWNRSTYFALSVGLLADRINAE
jgi:membrane-bound lytic murein transglycosylase B